MTRSEFLTQYSLLHPRTIYLPRPTWHFHMDDPWFAVNAMSTTNLTGNSLVVQWLGIRAFPARAWVQFSQWTKTSKAMQCGQQQQQQNKSNLTNLMCPVTVFISVSSNTIAPLRLTFLTDSKLVPMFHLGYYCHHSPYIYYIHMCVCVCVCVCVYVMLQNIDLYSVILQRPCFLIPPSLLLHTFLYLECHCPLH